MKKIYFNLEWDDLKIEKKFKILEDIKAAIKKSLEEEAKEKGISLKELMTSPKFYDLLWEYKDEYKEKFYEMELEEFLEKKADEYLKINFGYRLGI